MKNRPIYYITTIVLGILLFSCSQKYISTKYYYLNKNTLDNIEQSYMKLYLQRPFTLAFTDKKFETLSFDFITDSLTYIYEFNIKEKRLLDTLIKFNLNTTEATELINKMRSIRCTWVNKFDYYVDDTKKSLVFLSIKPVDINSLFSNKKYYILTYFPKKQYYDKEGRLVNNRKRRQLQKVNGDIFKRINDTVSYTVSSTFR